MPHQERVYIRREQPRAREERNDARLEWRWHIPFTPKKKEKKYVIIEETLPAAPMLHHAPPTPPLTPRRILEPNVVRISPRISPLLPAREHGARLIEPARERSQDRLDRRRREEADRLVRRREELEVRIVDLRAQQRARERDRDEARRERAHESRLRRIDADIARLRAELETSERRHRAAGGNILHQGGSHRPDFRIPHQDAGGGIRDGGAGLAGGRHARERAQDREIRELERRFDEERRRRRRETLTGTPHNGRRHEALPRQPRNEVAGVRIINRNGWVRM